MKILILGSKEYPMGTGDDPLKSGGIEVYTQHLVEKLRRKVEVIIITRKFKKVKSYEKNGNVEVYRVPWIRGFYLRNPTFNLAAFIKSLFLDCDIILSQGPVATVFAVIVSKLKRKKLVARPAGIAYIQPQYPAAIKKLLYFIEKLAYKGADMVVFLSEAEKNQFKIKLGYIPENHAVIPTGVEIADAKKDEIERIKKFYRLEGVVITFVGRLIAVKGLDLLINAVNGIEYKIKLLIVGDGPERLRLEKLVEKNNLQEKVVFAGWRRDISAILAASDIFVLPSYSEGLPLALLEAMAAGKACVVTDIGLPVEHRRDALVVKPGDVKELREALIELVENRELREKLGKNAKKKASGFTWEKTAEEYHRIFKSLSGG